jgi:hypothetical protein
MTAITEPNTVTATFLDVLDAIRNGDGGILDLRALRDGGDAIPRFYDPSNLDGIRNFTELYDDFDLYYGIATRRDATSGGTDNLFTLGCLFVDLDFTLTPEPAARETLARFPLPPSIVVASGNGLHAYWLLRESFLFPDDTDAAGTWLRRLTATLQADASSAEVARILRIPGSRNFKYVPPRSVVIEFFEPDRRYNPSEFDEFLAADPAPAGTRTGSFHLPSDAPGPGSRYKTLFAFGRSLRTKGMSEAQIRIALESYNGTLPKPKSAFELERTITNVLRAKHRKGFEVPIVETETTASTTTTTTATETAPTTAAEPATEPASTAGEEPADTSNAEQPINEPKAEAPALAELLDQTAAVICRFMVVTAQQADTLALWIALTHAVAAFDLVPYLHVTAGSKRAGKSRLLELLQHVVRRSWYTGRTTTAALVRKLAKDESTLLLDESDTALQGNSDYALSLVGVLNAGYSRHLTVTLCVGEGATITPKEFSVFGLKALAGIGALPSTVADRSIEIRLKRKLRTEQVERARDGVVRAALVPLARHFETWAHPHVCDTLRGMCPTLPDELDDRAQDIWEPLLVIADLAGGTWPGRAVRAARALSAGREAEADVATQLLADIRRVVTKDEEGKVAVRPHEHIFDSTELLVALEKLDDQPWATWTRGERMSPHALAKELRKVDVTPAPRKRVKDRLIRGYGEPALREAFERFLPPLPKPGGSGTSGTPQ